MSEIITRPEWTDLIDLASARLGAKALAASDDFFASKDNLLKPEPPVFIPGKFTDRGKWMDGWESRRKREPPPAHDWCIIKLGEPGSIRGVVIDTAHFNGNHPEACSIDAAEFPNSFPVPQIAGMLRGAQSNEARARLTGSSGTNRARQSVRSAKDSDISWHELIPRTPLRPSREHFIPVPPELSHPRFTHIRLNIFPDGGVARLRVHGHVLPDWPALVKAKRPIDIAAAANGALVIAASDMHFGSRHNMIMPGLAENMGDGWETRRKRNLTWQDGQMSDHDWAIIALAHRATISKVEVDTSHFKGNFPDSCMVEVCDMDPRATPSRFLREGVPTTPGASPAESSFDSPSTHWRVLIPRTKLKANAHRLFEKELDREASKTPITHARLTIYPDGGISRVRIWGRPAL